MNNKDRLLFLMKLLYETTDAEHRLSTGELCKAYADNQFQGNRDTVRNDIQALQDNGFKVVATRGKQNTYYLDGHLFTTAETRVLIDAVSSAQFLTKEQSNELIKKLRNAACRRDADQLLCGIPVPKTDNPEMYQTIQVISKAIADGKKIQFQYYTYSSDCSKILRHNGTPYQYSPYELINNDGRYYVLGYHEKRKDVSSFRIDLMCNAKELEEASTEAPETFNPEAYGSSIFRMYPGEKECNVVLECKNELMLDIVDHFGKPKQVFKASNDCFRVTVRCSISYTFFGWLSQFAGKVKIIDPMDVKKQYAAFGQLIFNENRSY